MAFAASQEVKNYLSQPRPMLINGEWVESASGKIIEVENPSNGEVIGQVYEAGQAEVDAAVAAARAAFESSGWRWMATSERASLLFKFADLIQKYQKELVELDVLSMGKTIKEAGQFDAWISSEILKYQAGWCTKITGKSSTPTLPDMRGEGSFGQPYHSYSVRQPIGVAGIIIPWNAPLVMAVAKLAPALAAGCTVVMKPAELSPFSPLLLAELIQEAGFPPGVVNMIPGYGAVAGQAMVEHPDIDKISFTGSTAVGKSIIRTVSDDMKRVTLELGGKSPVIVCEDADPEQVIPAAAHAIYQNCGQTCFLGSRLFVHRKIYEQVLEGVAKEADALNVGESLDPVNDIGPLVSQQAQDKVASFFEGDMGGMEVITGGARIDGDGYFFKPTLVAGANHKSRLFQEEVFGPVLAANVFDDIDEAVSMANDSVYGLAGGIFTNDLSRAHQIAGMMDTGSVWVNGYPVVDLNLPFGGFKQSGWGRENGEEGIEAYTETKTVTMALR